MSENNPINAGIPRVSSRQFRQLCQLIALNPTDIRYRSRLMSYYYRQDQFAEALAEVDKLLEIAPNRHHLLTFRALCLQAQGHPELALEEYEKLLLIDPESSSAYEGMGDVHSEEGRTDEAHQYWQRALQIREHQLKDESAARSKYGMITQLQRKLGFFSEGGDPPLTPEQRHNLVMRNRSDKSPMVRRRSRRGF